MKRLSLMIFLLCSLFSISVFASQVDEVRRASELNQAKLLKVIRELKEKKEANSFSADSRFSGRRCDDDDDKKDSVSCIKKCARRITDNYCAEYAPDFCGRDPVCVDNCVRRITDNYCAEYGEDSCF